MQLYANNKIKKHVNKLQNFRLSQLLHFLVLVVLVLSVIKRLYNIPPISFKANYLKKVQLAKCEEKWNKILLMNFPYA